MQKIVCEICGGTDFLRRDDGLIQCEYCGCSYTIEQARTILSGTVEVVHGKSELKQQLHSAESLCDLGYYDDMFRLYNDLKMSFSYEKSYWESLLHSYYHMFLNSEHLNLRSDARGNSIYKDLKQCFDNYIALCTSPEEVQRVKNEHLSFCQNFIQNCITGNFNLYSSIGGGYDCLNNLSKFCRNFPLASELLRQSDRNIQIVMNAQIEPDTYGRWGLSWSQSGQDYSPIFNAVSGAVHPPKNGPVWIMGKTYVVLRDGTYNVIILQQPFKDIDLSSIRTYLINKWNKNFDMGVNCPYCNGRLGMKILGQRKCSKCYRYISKRSIQ